MLDVRLACLQRTEKEVKVYEQNVVKEGKILFYGDSAFTRWSEKYGNIPLENLFLEKDGSSAVINHGFGGSTAEEQLYYYSRLVKPWKPRALVSQTYWNDWDLSYTPSEILFLQSRLFAYARHDMPGIQIYVCNVRPIMKEKEKEGNWYYHQKEYNELLAEYCAKHEDCTLVNQQADTRFFEEGAPTGDFRYEHIRKDIFIEDEVHYSQAGYDMYETFFRDVLKDVIM